LQFLSKFLQAKTVVQKSKAAQQENAALMAENMSLRKAILTKSCFTCGGAMVPAELPAENRPLLKENMRLRGECIRATALLNQILRSAPPAEQRPPAVVACRPAALSVGEGASKDDRTAGLRRHAEAAMDQFLLLATKGEPLWLPTPDGEELSYLGYQKKATLPVHHGFCPDGFIMEATRETGTVRAFVADLIVMLTDAVRACTRTHIFILPSIHSCSNRIAKYASKVPLIWCSCLCCLSIRSAGLRCSPASWRV
jgi:homeobox-leucine zipper protein